MKYYGSITNRIEEGRQVGELAVGMGATEMLYSDRHAYTVQKVISPKRVIVTRDKAVRVDDNGMSDCQRYEYTSTPLVEGKREKMCCHPLAGLLNEAGCRCAYKDGTCEGSGCGFYKMHTPTNGTELRLCKGGWKAVGSDAYFALGIREEYFDFSF